MLCRKCNANIDNELGKLVFDKHILVFDSGMHKRTLRATNVGLQDITIYTHKIVADSEFKVHLNGSNINIAPGETLPIEVELLLPVTQQSVQTLRIVYDVGIFSEQQEITLYKRKKAAETPDILCDRVVAVDFGISKTEAACVDIRKMYMAEGLRPVADLVALERYGEIPQYKIPSSIAYRGRDVLVGRRALASRGLLEYTSGMNMHLHDKEIVFNKFGLETRRDTREVITSFLKEIKERVMEEIGEGDNLFIFTLPVLDNDETGELYERQREMMLACAEGAGFGNRIRTISRPEAAMSYIINTIKNSTGSRDSVTLQPGDKICVFDYGSSTLDIFFGVYRLEDGIPFMDRIANISAYRDKEKPGSEAFSLGGNRLDACLAREVCKLYSEYLELDEPLYDEDNNLLSAKGISVLSPALNGVEWQFYEDELIKSRKEKLSRNWEEVDSVDIDDQSNLAGTILLTRELFSDVVYRDLYHAIHAMKEAIKTKKIHDLKYIFLVGGSSLIQIIKPKLKSEFPQCQVYNPYDLPREEGQEPNYEKIRQDAIYPVVKGAAVSYVTRITDVFDFDVTIAPVSYRGRPDCVIRYQRGERFYRQRKNLRGDIACGEWLITATLPRGGGLKLGTFHIEGVDENELVTVDTGITRQRQLNISYRLARGGYEGKLDDLDIII